MRPARAAMRPKMFGATSGGAAPSAGLVGIAPRVGPLLRKLSGLARLRSLSTTPPQEFNGREQRFLSLFPLFAPVEFGAIGSGPTLWPAVREVNRVLRFCSALNSRGGQRHLSCPGCATLRMTRPLRAETAEAALSLRRNFRCRCPHLTHLTSPTYLAFGCGFPLCVYRASAVFPSGPIFLSR